MGRKLRRRTDARPALSGTAGVRTPAAARQGGEGGGDLRNRVARQEGLPPAGRRPGPDAGQQPQASERKKEADYQTLLSGSIRHPTEEKKERKKDSPLTWRLSLVSDDVQASCRKGMRFPFVGTVRIVNSLRGEHGELVLPL